MIPIAGRARVPRGRILAIGDGALLEGGDFEPRNVEFAANLYEAIGEIAASTAAEPIEMVVIDQRALVHPLEVIAESIHRLDPGVLVYLAVRDDVDGALRHRALAARFDGVLDQPVSAGAVEKEITDPALPGLRPPPAAPRIHESTVEQDEAAAIQIQPESETARDQPREVIGNPALPARAAPALGSAEARDAIQSPGVLGDIDIVEAMLDDPARGIETALKLIAQETDWREIRFVSADEAPYGELCETGSGAVVALRGVSYGLLIAAGVTAPALEPWAAWLARWEALAASQRDLAQAARSDALTGAGNRRFFDEFFPRVLEEARQKRRQIPLMVFDVDNLKLFNDRHGHEAGDTVLRETVRLLRSIIRKGDQIFRIGGDEFVVVFADPDPPRKPGSGVIESVETIARRFQTEICTMNFPKLAQEAPGTLSISAGLATYPWDGGDAETLLRIADQLALESKRGGKNALTIGPGAAARCAREDHQDG